MNTFITYPKAPSVSHNPQNGNALFLILIAVILFAALSYAITQSNRSGSNTNEEANLIAAASVVGAVDGVKQDLLKMQLRGVGTDQLDFTISAEIDPAFDTPPFSNKLFHPQGGGAIFPKFNPNTVELDDDGLLVYSTYDPNTAWDVGASTCLDGINPCVIMVLVGVKKSVCEAINQKLTGSKTIPILTGVNVARKISTTLSGEPVPGAQVDFRTSLCVTGTDESDYAYYNFLTE